MISLQMLCEVVPGVVADVSGYGIVENGGRCLTGSMLLPS